jgi:hypothetical protein
MPASNPAMHKACPAVLRADVHWLSSKKTAERDGVAVTFQPKARWPKDLKAYAGTELCELPPVALVMAGILRVVLRGSSQQDFSAGDVMLLPPGHDAWAAGDQASTFVECSRGNRYGSAGRLGHGDQPRCGEPHRPGD